jgi:hypothetical protein
MLSEDDLESVEQAVVIAMDDLGISGWSFNDNTDFPVSEDPSSNHAVIVQLVNRQDSSLMMFPVDIKNALDNPRYEFATNLVADMKRAFKQTFCTG